MLDFQATDRSTLEARMTSRLADYARQLLVADAANVDCDGKALLLLDLATGRQELRAATDEQQQQLLIGHLLYTHHLNQVAVPVLSAVPYTLTIPGGGSSGPVYWENVLNKPVLVTKAQLDAALAGVATTRDIIVSLAGGKTWGTLKTGDLIPAGTRYQSLLERALVEAILPSYTPATLGLAQSAPVVGEVGETVSLTLTATFGQNDAGPLTGLRIQRDGLDLTQNGNSTAPASNPTSPSTRTDTLVRTLAGVSYRAVAAYGAGPRKPVAPANTPDPRPAQVRQADAPQAAEAAFASAALTLPGLYRAWYGPTAAVPGAGQVRQLADSFLVGGGGTVVLSTGTTDRRFALWLPAGHALTGANDLDALNADLTSQYMATPLAVPDAAGVARPGTLYVYEQALPYVSSHRHSITFS